MRCALALLAGCLLASLSWGQNVAAAGIGAGFGQGRGTVSLGSGLPPISPIPPFGVQRGAPGVPFRHRPGSGFPRFGGYPAFPYALPAYGWGPAAYPAQPDMVVVQVVSPPEREVVEPPARPVESTIREYDWPEEEPAARHEPAYFVIALRDQKVIQARAVWVQQSELHYFTPEGAHRQLSIDEVEPEATRNLNREQGLNLQLPVL